MSSTKIDAAVIREALKIEGYNARRVSIRCEYYSMGASIYATIRDATVDAEKVREIVERIGEHISRDERGDILSEGNTYTHIDYSRPVRNELRARYEDVVLTAVGKLDKNNRSRLEAVAGFTNVHVGIGRSGWDFALWIDGTMGREFDNAATGSLEIAMSPKAAACDTPESTPDPEPDTRVISTPDEDGTCGSVMVTDKPQGEPVQGAVARFLP